ncbi:hypothetical protein SH528x_003581 [Novipirellula sp. SH528]
MANREHKAYPSIRETPFYSPEGPHDAFTNGNHIGGPRLRPPLFDQNRK